jgi:sterol desaturase/sphingolipid hydroxylase (fatty acid hydroxylase superfamily)
LQVRVRPLTSISFLPLEHLFYDIMFALPLLVCAVAGDGSITYFATAIAVMVDLPNTLGHANHEFMPTW